MLLGTGGPKVEELTGDWRKVHNESLHGFDSSLNLAFYVPRVMIVTSRNTHTSSELQQCFQIAGCLPLNTLQPTRCATSVHLQNTLQPTRCATSVHLQNTLQPTGCATSVHLQNTLQTTGCATSVHLQNTLQTIL